MKRQRTIIQHLSRILLYTALLAGAFTMLVPFLWMGSTSFMTDIEVYSYPPRLFPERLRWENYMESLTILPFGRFFFNTLLISSTAVAGQLLTCSMAAYAFARIDFKGRNILFAIYLSTMMVPVIVTMIPAYLIVSSFGWINTYWALLTPVLTSAWGIFLLRQNFQTIPREYEEAARIDGASDWQIFWRVILPASKPALATLAVFTLMGTWKDFLWPLIVTSSNELRPVEVGIAMFSTLYTTNWPYQMAAAVVVMLPIILVFLFTQRYFVEGITLSGLKG